MKPLQPQESKHTSENQSRKEASNDCQSKQHNNTTSLLDLDPASTSSSTKKVTKEDIQIVQNLIEGCIVKYMNRNEVIKTLWNQEGIDPVFTALAFCRKKLEERNAEFFRDYNTRLELLNQIRIFNYLLECQNDVMLNLVPAPPNAPFTPTQNTVNPMPANNLPMHHADNSPQPTGVNSKTMMETFSVEAPPVIPSTSSCGSTTLDGALPCIIWGLPDLNNPANLADIEPLENYPRSPFLPSSPNIDSPKLVEKYFTDLDME